MSNDTIAAIATGLSNAGISIIRISGDNSLSIIDRIYRSKSANKLLSKEKSHTIHYGYIVDNEEIVDEVMVSIMRAPKTYTREDTIEINCHGGIVVTRKVFETVLKYGARIAEPGEFTKRAFLNGRIDLSQAEAVCDIIHAKNELSLKNSLHQLKGRIHHIITDLRNRILRDIAFIEAALDDPEHISLDGFQDELANHIKQECDEINQLIKESKNGKIIKEGIKTAIIGKPNAGKSSLLNSLVGEERAIVTDIAGTTRDTLEEIINFNGIMLNVIDTAGIRDTVDVIEKMGVEKALRIADEADLIIYVLDSSTELDDNDENILKLIENKKALLVLNKTDLDTKISTMDIEKKTNHPIISMSVKENLGFDQLENMIRKMFFEGEITFNEDIYITNDRHREAFQQALDSLQMVLKSIEADMPEDFYSIDLMNAYEVLGRIIGENVEEDLVNMIFKEFCMGK
ncbi:tRNA uridine-5-carboxymethylaminomethyl(34) synthesis GTPase MnmE [Lachnospiraceae bacterium MD1]|jgi:tRNA modification GTPase|uniref:tRNA modification GTPase MnmE n=1 Tax=Variimorphobacter saccharofermentans TaxID=2755051 RepID=A0A839K4B7_9FIRM|nr:tRNA uridine-5-carboxymethylaminomethyl(34) synthesis GTPase MnmE [Variimorphobacter saccharofermentans]MBB2184743.1 tRNA uridine-5-carboxymethylaminomethyl(34) synthesis GTPase MnmE [Variimorphobacter saccharofermentans]